MLTLETPRRAACCHLAALKARNSSWQERVRQLATQQGQLDTQQALASQQGHSAFQKCFQNLLGGGAVGGGVLSF